MPLRMRSIRAWIFKAVLVRNQKVQELARVSLAILWIRLTFYLIRAGLSGLRINSTSSMKMNRSSLCRVQLCKMLTITLQQAAIHVTNLGRRHLIYRAATVTSAECRTVSYVWLKHGNSKRKRTVDKELIKVAETKLKEVPFASFVTANSSSRIQ